MASDAPRTRIDQFYASRKKNTSSPSLTSEKPDNKLARIAVSGGSPSAKGNLDNYLVNSQNVSLSPKQDQVKKNLALEINLKPEAVRKFEISSDREALQAVDARPKVCEGTVPSSSGTVNTDGLETDNPELKRFAADFLSLYCSDLPSNERLPFDQKFSGQKRNLCSSQPGLKCESGNKKQCTSVQDIPNIEGAVPGSDEEHSKYGAYNVNAKNGEPVFYHSMQLAGTSSTTEPCARLRKCNMPNTSNLDIGGCHTPSSSVIKVSTHGTPNSSRSNSLFSPGEAFWNEAIHLADGLFVPVDRLSVNAAKELSVVKNDCEEQNFFDLKSEVSLDKLGETRDEGGTGARNVEANASFGVAERHAKGNVEFLAVGSDKQVSPLPVRHFDFLHEEKNIGQKTTYQYCTGEQKDSYRDDRESNSETVKHKAAQTSHILSCKPFKGKTGSSFLISSHMGEMPSLSGEVHREEMISLPVTAENKGVSSCQENDTKKDFRSPSVTNQRCNEGGTPSSSLLPSDSLELASWLPSEICSIYMKRGISKLYPWQVNCLKVDGVLQTRNLVYCASTSAGKSFVAEILMLRRVMSTGKMALLVLPYVSICSEKAEHLEGLLEPLGKHVRSFYGNQGGGTLPKDTSVAVCTIEKANFLVNRLLEEGRLSEVGIIVIDELHMVGDESRGYLLELMLTKLRYAAGEGNVGSSSEGGSGASSGKVDPTHGLQIVGMSATMPNVSAVADWLQAALYQTDFRPVPLEEYIKIGNSIYTKKMELMRTVPKVADLSGKDPDHVVELCNEVVQEGHSVLLFCSTRKGCESTARHVAKFIKKFSVSSHDGRSEFGDIPSALDALRRCPVGLDPILEETLPSGVAYHHAGLTVEEREIIETCYRKSLVCVLTATSTLAAGVNLPARRVIFRQPRVGRDFIDGTRYRQMAGRAGRTGIDTKGESVLICKPEEVKKVAAVLNDSCPPLQSCLSEDKNGMTHAILEVVAGGIVQTAGDIHRYVRCTLLNSTKPFEDVVKSAQDSLRWLCQNKFLDWNEETKLYGTTPLGRAAFGSSLSPEESLVVLDDLSRAREGFVLASDLHLVYLVTPINVDVEPDWELYYERFMQLSVLEQSVGNRVGVEEPFLMRMAHGAPMHLSNKSRENTKAPQRKSETRNFNSNSIHLEDQTLRVCKRFYVALILSRLVQEVPVADVCEAFKVARGMVQALQENAGRFASMVSMFCERLGWHDVEGLVAKFQNRVSFGVRAEIVELTTIPYVKGSRARALYKAGLRTPLAIAESTTSEIAKALFESSSWHDKEGSAQRRMQLGIAKKIKNGARKIVLEKAEEARVAAFSTFKSLGLVPQFLQPLVSSDARAPAIQDVAMVSSRKDTVGSFVGEEPVSSVKAKVTERKNENFDHVGLERGSEKLTKIPYSGNSQRMTSVSAVQCMTSLNNLEGVVEESDQNVGSGSTSSTNYVQDLGLSPSLGFGSAANDRAIELGKSGANHVEDSGVSPRLEFGSAACDRIIDPKPLEGSCSIQIQRHKSNYDSYNRGPVLANSMSGGFDSFLDLWDSVEEFFFDVHFTKRSELNSLIPFEVHGIAICWENSPVYYVNLSKDLFGSGKLKSNVKHEDLLSPTMGGTRDVRVPNLPWQIAKCRWNRIVNIMARNKRRKFCWNLKVQIQVFKKPGVSVQRFGSMSISQHNDEIEVVDDSHFLLPPIHVQNGVDMCIIAWLLWPDEERSSNPNIEKEVKKRLSNELAAAASRSGRWRNQMCSAAHNGCCRRVSQTRALGSVLWKLIVSEKLDEALIGIENPLVNVLADMELWGIGVDMERCLRARHILWKKLKELEKEAYRLAGTTFSLSNPADIADVLYGRLKLPIPEGCAKGKQHPSTDKHSLDLLRNQHPIICVIKEYRTLAKLLNCTLGSMCTLARICVKSQMYKLHGHWLQTSTATGRLSMEEPNLQCVEHTINFKINDINSKQSVDCHVINARDFFIPTQENWLLLTADYSQIELRLMAHFSKDPSLIEILTKPTGDVFTMIAARWTGRLESMVSSIEREQTKRLVYGILYGMGRNTLAQQLECALDEAADKIKSFKSCFPGVASWLQEAVDSCRQKGYIETLMKRKRFLSKIKFGNSKEKGKAQRQAVNSICQGSAADIIKIAMIKIHSVIVEGYELHDLSSKFAASFSSLKGHCRLLLQVHDELVLEVDPSVKREAGLLLQYFMETAVSLLVPLHVKLKIGRTWGSLEPYLVEPHTEPKT